MDQLSCHATVHSASAVSWPRVMANAALLH